MTEYHHSRSKDVFNPIRENWLIMIFFSWIFQTQSIFGEIGSISVQFDKKSWKGHLWSILSNLWSKKVIFSNSYSKKSSLEWFDWTFYPIFAIFSGFLPFFNHNITMELPWLLDEFVILLFEKKTRFVLLKFRKFSRKFILEAENGTF